MNGRFEEIWSDLCSVILLTFAVNYKITSSTGLPNDYFDKNVPATFVDSKGEIIPEFDQKNPCKVRTNTWETQQRLFYYISDKECVN